MAQNKVKLDGVVVWSEAQEKEFKDGGKGVVHKYLIRNTIKTEGDKSISNTFYVEDWQNKDKKNAIVMKGLAVVVVGVLAINYIPIKDKKGNPVTEKGSDGKEYNKTRQEFVIRAESVVCDEPF